MRGWLIPYVLLVGVATLTLASCSESKEPPPSTPLAQVSPPEQAPASLVVMIATIPLFVSDTFKPPPPPPPPCDTPFAVDLNLEDSSGSGQYTFDPSELTYKVGQCVDFKLTSETEFHTFSVSKLEIDVSVDAGETVNYSFTFDKPGTYELFCVPHKSEGMVGTITVTQ